MNLLKTAGLVERVGGAKGEHWAVQTLGNSKNTQE
jgi:hypothetical protein